MFSNKMKYHSNSKIIIAVLLFLLSFQIYAQKNNWKAASFEVVKSKYKTFKTTQYAHVFSGSKHNIVGLAPELEGLTGVEIPLDLYKNGTNAPLKLKFKENAVVLVGIFQDKGNKEFLQLEPSSKSILLLQNGVTITGLPPVNVYALSFEKGTHSILPDAKGLFAVLGVVKVKQALVQRNAEKLDGRLWNPTYIIEGFSDEKPLFEIIGGENKPVIDEGFPGTEGIQGGFEGGRVVKVGDTYHMFPTERAGEKGIEMYYDRVKTKIGHWTSKDAIHWKRESTILQASGTYAITEDDNPMNDRRGAIWSYMPVFNEKENKWYGYYLAYTVHKEIQPNHSFGRIWRCESTVAGINGIAGPYKDIGIIMEPGLDSQPWEGRQGVASFFPYQVGDKFYGFYSGAYPFESWKDYPKKSGKGWFVALAESNSLEGPWFRMNKGLKPIQSIHPLFVENPIVSQLPNGLYIAVFDGGPEGWGHHLPNMMGYTLSKDGIHWSEAHYWPIETKVDKWWDIMRTPLCLIPEGNDVYTIVYNAIDLKKRFHPTGMVKLKLNREVMDARLKEMK
ncbi:Glycoside hydrolase [Flavobacterium daejeonense]|nr:Glycoside hydrolase [Flavobacterium daejeonense]